MDINSIFKKKIEKIESADVYVKELNVGERTELFSIYNTTVENKSDEFAKKLIFLCLCDKDYKQILENIEDINQLPASVAEEICDKAIKVNTFLQFKEESEKVEDFLTTNKK